MPERGESDIQVGAAVILCSPYPRGRSKENLTPSRPSPGRLGQQEWHMGVRTCWWSASEPVSCLQVRL